MGLQKLPPKSAEIGGVAESVEFSDRVCWKSWARLLRLRRRLPADIAETAEIAGSAENSDISKIIEIAETVGEIAGMSDIAGRERVTTCWDWKK